MKTESVLVTVVVRGAERIEKMDLIRDRDHSSRSAVLNKALDLLAEHEAVETK
jgi:hypothetical protein